MIEAHPPHSASQTMSPYILPWQARPNNERLSGFFCMLKQSNSAPSTLNQFDLSHHTCLEDILLATLGLPILVRWTYSIQSVGRSPVLPIRAVVGHPADPVTAYNARLTSSHTTHPNQPLFTVNKSQD